MSLISKTTSGTSVTLTGIDDYDHPTVEVSFHHPKHGQLSFRSDNYGTIQGHNGIIGYVAGQRCCITVPKADFMAALNEARAIGEKEIADIKAGVKLIEVRYHDGEYLSSHEVLGRAGDLLLELGLARNIAGWGCCVDDDVVKALGTSFTYAAAAEYARPALEAKEAQKTAAAAERQTKIDEARSTGKRVVLRSWMDECDGSACECSWDHVTEYAMPDGTTKHERIHTH